MASKAKSGWDDDALPPRFEPGHLIQARFRIDHLVGQGGMGEVYRAENLATGEAVALKLILPQLLGSAKTRARFEREQELTRSIDHPNVVRIHELLHVPSSDPNGLEDPMPCLVMEYLEGVTLADHLEYEGPMECSEAKPILAQVAAALSAAHRQGVVHRDLKPDNIFLVDAEKGEEPRVVLTDFGVARKDTTGSASPDLSDSLTASNVIPGTPEYMAPELLELEEAIPASDIYAMGLVFHQLVTGVLPFDGEPPLRALFQRVRQPVPSPRELRPDLDPACEKAILRCLERDPGDRYADAQDLIRDLEGDDSPRLVAKRREIPREYFVIASVGLVLVLLALGLVALVAS